jgi:hypothetical protein
MPDLFGLEQSCPRGRCFLCLRKTLVSEVYTDGAIYSRCAACGWRSHLELDPSLPSGGRVYREVRDDPLPPETEAQSG